MTPEKTYERELIKAVESRGGIALKQTSEYRRGIPDRLILQKGGRAEWVELKSDGKKPTKLQSLTHEALRRLEFKVTVIDSKNKLEEYIKTL